MFASKPVILLSKPNAPRVSIVLLSAIVGLSFVLQQTPQSIIPTPPSSSINPPDVAVEIVIFVTSVVDTTGTSSLLQPSANTKNNPIK